MTTPGAIAELCAICGRDGVAQYKPFCSRRCADVDLARWFTGSYAIPAEPAPNGAAGAGARDGHERDED